MFTYTRPRRLLLCALLALVALGGCSSQSPLTDDTAGEPAIGEIPMLVATAELRLPVEDYLPTVAQQDRLARARVTLIETCMARFGFAYDVTPVPSGRYGPVSLTERRYGITDLALARTFGYGLGPRDPSLSARPDQPRLGAAGANVLTGQGRSVVVGLAVPDGGCIGEADRALTNSATSTDDLFRGSRLQSESYARSRADSRVRDALESWSVCMAGGGYHYADPLAASADPAFTGAVDQQQIDVAVADIACKATTNVIGIWFATESAYQRRAIEADRAAFARTLDAIQARDRLAAAAIC